MISEGGRFYLKINCLRFLSPLPCCNKTLKWSFSVTPFSTKCCSHWPKTMCIYVCVCARASKLISSFATESIYYSSRCSLFRLSSLNLNSLESEVKMLLCPYLHSKRRTWPEDWCASHMTCPINRAVIFLFASCKTWKEFFIWGLAFKASSVLSNTPFTRMLNYRRDVD